MEWLNSDKKYYYRNRADKFDSYGQLLGLTIDIKEDLGYVRFNEGKWFLNDTFFGRYKNSFFNPMIQVKISQ
jgi:hypothetical protein